MKTFKIKKTISVKYLYMHLSFICLLFLLWRLNVCFNSKLVLTIFFIYQFLYYLVSFIKHKQYLFVYLLKKLQYMKTYRT